jgi:hypothetical protein
VPATFELHEMVAVPVAGMLVEDIGPQLSPAGGASVSDTVPVKPFFAPIAIVELADWPALIGEGELEVTVKSGGGGPALRKVRRHPQPMGLLPHWSAP